MAVQYPAAAESDLLGSYTFMAVTEEKMLGLDSPLLEKKNIMEDRLWGLLYGSQ